MVKNDTTFFAKKQILRKNISNQKNWYHFFRHFNTFSFYIPQIILLLPLKRMFLSGNQSILIPLFSPFPFFDTKEIAISSSFEKWYHYFRHSDAFRTNQKIIFLKFSFFSHWFFLKWYHFFRFFPLFLNIILEKFCFKFIWYLFFRHFKLKKIFHFFAKSIYKRFSLETIPFFSPFYNASFSLKKLCVFQMIPPFSPFSWHLQIRNFCL